VKRKPRTVRVSLQTKVVIGLLAIAVVPTLVAVFFVQQVADVAQSVAIGEADRLYDTLERTRLAYVESVEARKASFRASALLAATDEGLARSCRAALSGENLDPLSGENPDPVVDKELARLLGADRWLGAVVLEGPDFRTVAERDLIAEKRLASFQSMRLENPLVGMPECRLTMTYVTDRGLRLGQDLATLGDVLREHKKIEKIRTRLPPWYKVVFAISVGSFALALTLAGIFVARRTTRRIDRLVAATRRVAEGDLESRVDVAGPDELGDLARAFDEMTAELRRSRAEIEYLEKIGAWQEIARRLAHEIKNPLTPIQLAVQQLHTKYGGEDPRFRAMLDDAHAIVTEEIAGLRRLVDAFSGFAKLPRVEPAPLDLALVVDDVARDFSGGEPERRDRAPERGAAERLGERREGEPSRSCVLDVDPPKEPITVAGDRLLLRRALTNLVENAKQAGAKKIRIGWRDDGARARLTIDDDGPGVPADLRPRIFDPYVTTKPHGTGLGLAIVKKTILEHGGEITLSATPSPLGGARFEITLPV
jgi:two-component system, NtrC family, nitrogen regulation sensor histidine kinase NtrY